MGAFNIFKSKNHKTVHHETTEEYYIKLSSRTRTATVLLAVLLAVMVIAAFSAYGDQLTLDNVRYMLKFINTENAAANENDVIYFDSDIGNKGCLLAESLAVYNPSGITFYDNNGEKTLTDLLRTDSALTAVGGKNLLMCDLGGYELRAYTAYQKSYSETFSYPILGLAASDSGSFAVISSVKGYRSAVMIYNSYFRVIYTRKFGEYYVNCVDIFSTGNRFVTAAMYSDEGKIHTGLYLFSTDSEDPVAFVAYPGELPLAVKCFKSGGYALLTDTSLRFYGSDGSMQSVTDISSLGAKSFLFGENCCALLCETRGLSTGSRLLCISSDGGTAIDTNFDTAIKDTAFAGGRLYILLSGRLHSFDVTDGSSENYEVSEDFRELVAGDRILMLFSGDSAVVYKTFDD